MGKHVDVKVPTDSILETAILVDGGFTYNPNTGTFLRANPNNRKGYMVAVPHTESTDVEDLITAWITYTAVPRPFQTFIGGWYDPEREKVILELAELVTAPIEDATRIGNDRDQDAILDIRTGDTIWIR